MVVGDPLRLEDLRLGLTCGPARPAGPEPRRLADQADLRAALLYARRGGLR
jgi:hypothetical protein